VKQELAVVLNHKEMFKLFLFEIRKYHLYVVFFQTVNISVLFYIHHFVSDDMNNMPLHYYTFLSLRANHSYYQIVSTHAMNDTLDTMSVMSVTSVTSVYD